MALVAPELEDTVGSHKSESSAVFEYKEFDCFIDLVTIVAEIINLQLVEVEMAAFAHLFVASLCFELSVSLPLGPTDKLKFKQIILTIQERPVRSPLDRWKLLL